MYLNEIIENKKNLAAHTCLRIVRQDQIGALDRNNGTDVLYFVVTIANEIHAIHRNGDRSGPFALATMARVHDWYYYGGVTHPKDPFWDREDKITP